MKLTVLLTTLVLTLAPGAVMAMCSGHDQKVVDCSAGEMRDPVSGQCTKAVHS
ncbi:adenylosuccinate lyase [Gemmobacter nectariphilus]|uniref:adenylosuccinate lyase n=1 Tax=Gemmobacter nectariphilus TaxID=220343 RepID=UPI00040EAE4B|nr:adenylosuccinate lyase [Gemmobacter nectariphilus]